MKTLAKLILSILLCLSAGFVGSIFTSSSIDSWYVLLDKPFFTPPSWVFAPVWTSLFILMGISLFLIWNVGLEKENVKIAIQIFLVQLALNALWSFVFFGFRQIFWAFLEIILLWIWKCAC